MNSRYYVKIAYLGGPDLSLRIPLLKLLQRQGYDVYAVGSNEEESSLFKDNNIPYIFYPLNKRFKIFSDFKSLYRLFSIFRQEGFKIVHAFDTKPSILGRIAASLARVPIIIGTISGMGTLFSDENLSNKILRMFYIYGQKIACSASNLTIFQNSEDLAFFVAKRIAPLSKVTIIKGSGVDIDQFSPEKWRGQNLTRLKTELGLNSNNIIISMITRVGKLKGVYEYLGAAKIINARYRNVQFYLVGPIDELLSPVPVEVLKEYEFVKYLGFRKDIPEILSLFDIMVLPTYYREGIPRVLLEAACMEKPIITTNIPGCKDLVEDGVNGLLVPPKDEAALAAAMEKLLLNRDLRAEMGKKGRMKVIKEFSLSIVFDKTSSIYEKLLSGIPGNQ